ncbi:G2/M phase-specific E3 ubiquitin-protein ligase [Anabarilius grahami]|uniref:G2/M phase-specific E3 ubiquitin-protein ligase n=1 Tax=Anabarilius grahami TaxID=495550 RepID=A0A3N0XHB4_ANAGA|nr:G2/M phase-specific E3 ubiquitin-protein ligase [Anabarilius grahami]
MNNQRQLANVGQSQGEYPDVVSAAQSLISALTQTLNQSPVSPRSQVQVQGGCGLRRLNIIPPDSEGYTGSQIKSASASGKTMLYVVPLQEELDLNPLPTDAREFQKMPKATCQMCNKSMPLQVLALHIQVCKSHESTSSNEETDVQFVSESNLDEMKQENSASEVMCISRHSLEDLLKLLASRVNSENQFRICVSRDNLLERGLKQWQRQKKGNPVNQLKVTFIGEAGVDSGALRKEFLTEMINGIETRLFLGQRAKSPQYSNSDLDNGLFRTAGEIFAVSLAQGGPAPCFLKEWCYFYLTNGEIDVHRICKDDVDDIEYSLLISKVEEATDLNELMDEIISCGYTGTCNTDHKDAIIRAGITKKKETFRGKKESCLHNTCFCFYKAIESPEDAEVETDPSNITVPGVMQWITGQGHKPLLLSEQEAFKIVFKFDHECQIRMPQHTICYPVVSACTQTITFPVVHMETYESFKCIILQAIKSGGAFSRV